MEELKEWSGCESDEEPCFDEMRNREFQPEFCKPDKLCTMNELTQHLESLKKDELIYKVKIAACKEILSKKLKELKQAELQLNEKHEVVWKNREEFCLEADKFINNYGPFSEWWEAQLNYVSDLENLKQKQVEEAKSKEEIGAIQNEIDKLEEELEKKNPTQTVAEVEVHATEDGNIGLKSAFLERRHVVTNLDTTGQSHQRTTAHTPVNDSGNQVAYHTMSADHASPAPGLGTLSSVVMHSPLTTALAGGNSNNSLSPSPTPQSVQVKAAETHTQILTRPRLQDLVKEVDASEQLDEEVEELLLQLADDFVESTVNAACIFAKHRHANTVDIKDVQLHLERNWNMSIPGFGTDELRPYKRAAVTEAHKQRMALIRKALKKY